MSVSPAPMPGAAQSPVAPMAVAEPLARMSFYRRPALRQRILDLAGQFGTDTLQDVEILLLSFSAADRRKGIALAESLVARFGGLPGVLAADRAELRRHVGAETVLSFRILREVATRLTHAALGGRPLLTSFGAVSDFFKVKLRGLPQEEVWGAFLDKKNQLIIVERLGRGTVDHAPVYVREVMKRALECGASALVLAHNHPSGDPTPSHDDIVMTKALADAGKTLGLTVHDHLVIGAEAIASFKTLGLL